MPTYLELKQQAEQLLAQAEQLRQKEREEAIADIKAKMQAYGITGQDIGLGPTSGGRSRGERSGSSGRPARAAKPAAAPKYRGPNGETWSGGRGRKPQWVVQALAQGKSLEDFAIR